MYVNFTSYGTYIWNISKLRREEKMPKTTTMRANKATMSSTTDKVNKRVYLLPVSLAKYYSFRLDKKRIKLDEEDKTEQKKTIKGLF